MVDTAGPALVLGSASPRRAALLESLGVPFVVSVVEIDELAALDAPLSGRQAVAQIAAAKFAAFDEVSDAAQTLLTADTLVECDQVVMGKPSSPDEVNSMLHQMSARTLEISTAVCLGPAGSAPPPITVTTMVTLRSLLEDEIERYVASGSGLDKAAGLALQSSANGFIESVEGCWSNVVGLPLCAVAQGLDLAPHGTSYTERCSNDLCGAG